VKTVLVVDDEPQIIRALRINLRVRQYEVYVAATGTEALRQASRHPPDLVILDLGLPDLDGVDVIHGLRGWTAAPIIVLSGRADATDKVAALDAGADDYVTKPFSMEELFARMRAVGRRSIAEGDEPRFRLGDLVVDLAAKRVFRDPRPDGHRGAAADGHRGAAAGGQQGAAAGGQQGAAAGGQQGAAPAATQQADIRLTPTEWHLLEVLLRHPGKLLGQQYLLTEVWGPGYGDAAGNLRLYMAQLRRKLEPDPSRPRWLLTEPGMGYRFQPDPDDEHAAGGGERG
jgi:two-component system, OmpR family, KDP operon response regulator KdpE